MKNRTALIPAAPAPGGGTLASALSLRPRSLALGSQRRAVQGLGEQHLLGEDQVRALVVGEFVVVAHRDRVERAGDLAVAAEDAARQVDLVPLRVSLARRDAVLGRV